MVKTLTLPDIDPSFHLAHDSFFREQARFSLPPRPGQVKSLEGNGSYTVEVDDQDGGTVTAWPLNAFVYAVDDIVYIAYASNTADSAIILGSYTPAPDLSTVDITGDNVRVQTDQTPASATAAGLKGEIAWDADYIYVCVDTNTWKRAAIATWP